MPLYHTVVLLATCRWRARASKSAAYTCLGLASNLCQAAAWSRRKLRLITLSHSGATARPSLHARVWSAGAVGRTSSAGDRKAELAELQRLVEELKAQREERG